jgi:hypothetical protein
LWRVSSLSLERNAVTRYSKENAPSFITPVHFLEGLIPSGPGPFAGTVQPADELRDPGEQSLQRPARIRGYPVPSPKRPIGNGFPGKSFPISGQVFLTLRICLGYIGPVFPRELFINTLSEGVWPGFRWRPPRRCVAKVSKGFHQGSRSHLGVLRAWKSSMSYP